MKEPDRTNDGGIKRHLCTNCGADMVFDPASGKLSCPYCDTKKTISSNLADLTEQDLQEFLNIGAASLQPLAKNAKEVTCDSCGATVTFVPPDTATSCDFCAAKLVAQPRDANPLVAPKGILPFSLTGGQALGALKDWTRSRWFAPNSLKTMARHNDAEGVYVPYWTFDADTETDYTGQRGDNYQDVEHYTDSDGNTKRRTRTRIRWSWASGNVSRHFDDAAVPASTSVLPDYLDRLEWNFRELTSYDPAYLSGHKAQTYQVTLEEGFEAFQGLAEDVISGDVKRDIGGDHQRISSMSTTFSNVTFKHILTPVYAGAYLFNKKSYQVVINGRTGEVFGERPYSAFKIGCLVLVILAAILLVVFLISMGAD